MDIGLEVGMKTDSGLEIEMEMKMDRSWRWIGGRRWIYGYSGGGNGCGDESRLEVEMDGG